MEENIIGNRMKAITNLQNDTTNNKILENGEFQIVTPRRKRRFQSMFEKAQIKPQVTKKIQLM